MEQLAQLKQLSDDFLKDRNDLSDIDNLDKWKLLLTKSEIKLAVKHCANKINELFKGKDVIVVCILKGCVYFFTDLTKLLTQVAHSAYFIEASSYHNEQTQSETLEILSLIIPEKFKNKHVILLDELHDNGKTLYNIKNHLIDVTGVPSDKIFTCTALIKDRETEYPPPDLYGIRLPNVWAVGYGLDHNQKNRNWTYLYACPKVEGVPKSKADEIFVNDDVYLAERQKLISQLEKF